jgi:hypothetical protein
MKYVFLVFIFAVTNAVAQDASHWSVGIGSNYGGVGVKYSQPIASHLDLYANLGQSAGFALLSYKNGIASSAGAEFSFTPNQRHTLNLGAALLDGADHYNEYSHETDKNRLRGYVIGYTYYFAGLHSSGQAVGVGQIHLTDDDEVLNSLTISWGYKF